jgi:hypothetical protein
MQSNENKLKYKRTTVQTWWFGLSKFNNIHDVPMTPLMRLWATQGHAQAESLSTTSLNTLAWSFSIFRQNHNPQKFAYNLSRARGLIKQLLSHLLSFMSKSNECFMSFLTCHKCWNLVCSLVLSNCKSLNHLTRITQSHKARVGGSSHKGYLDIRHL